MDLLSRAFDAAVDDVLPGERAVVSVINTDRLDRYKTVIVPSGIDLTQYRKNPVVLLEHGASIGQEGKLPIGRNQWIKLDSGKTRLIAKTIFASEEANPIAGRVFRLLQEDMLRGFSVQLRQIEWGAPTSAELKKRPDWQGAITIYRKTELLEYSVTGLPGNPDTVALAVSRGLALPGWEATAPKSEPISHGGKNETRAEPELPPLMGRTFGQAHTELIRAIRAGRPDVARIVQDRLDLLRGRV